MPKIMTVLGPTAPESLGFTSMHEHVLADLSATRKVLMELAGASISQPVDENSPVSLENLGFHHHNHSLTWDNLLLDDEATMIGEVNNFKKTGGSAILELSAPGIRIPPEGIKRISKETGVPIVVSTGLYAEYSWPERFKDISIDGLTDHFLHEIEAGIDGTGIRPGHIKIAIEDNALSQGERKLIKAASRTCLETGLSITVHNGILLTPEGGRLIAKSLLEEGVPPDRVVFAHMQQYMMSQYLDVLLADPKQWIIDLAFIKEVLDLGFNVCFDTFFGQSWDFEELGLIGISDYHQLTGIIRLAHEGYASQIVLGTDLAFKTNLKKYGGEGYSRLTSFIVPALERYGVSAKDIHRITIDNPARLLARA